MKLNRLVPTFLKRFFYWLFRINQTKKMKVGFHDLDSLGTTALMARDVGINDLSGFIEHTLHNLEDRERRLRNGYTLAGLSEDDHLVPINVTMIDVTGNRPTASIKPNAENDHQGIFDISEIIESRDTIYISLSPKAQKSVAYLKKTLKLPHVGACISMSITMFVIYRKLLSMNFQTIGYRLHNRYYPINRTSIIIHEHVASRPFDMNNDDDDEDD